MGSSKAAIAMNFVRATGPWKSAAITEKRQQDCETKSVRAMLIHHQGMIVWRECPMIIRANDWLHHALKSWSSLTHAL